LVLLVAGTVDPDIIRRHRRLQHYAPSDYEVLRALLSDSPIYVTPNTLTEASNLLRTHADPERTALTEQLRALIQASNELIVLSATAADIDSFELVGLTDAVVLAAGSTHDPMIPILTADAWLHHLALRSGNLESQNFMNLRTFG